MLEKFGKVVYEYPSSHVMRKRLKYVGIGVFGGVLGTVIFLLYIPSLPAFRGMWLDLTVYAAVLWVICLFGGYLLSLEYNQFGIFEKGFCPPRRPIKIFGGTGRYFIPYAEIEKVDIDGKIFPRTPFFFTISLKDGSIIEFDVGDFIVYIGNDKAELKRIFNALMAVFRQVEEKKKRGSRLRRIDPELLRDILG